MWKTQTCSIFMISSLFQKHIYKHRMYKRTMKARLGQLFPLFAETELCTIVKCTCTSSCYCKLWVPSQRCSSYLGLCNQQTHILSLFFSVHPTIIFGDICISYYCTFCTIYHALHDIYVLLALQFHNQSYLVLSSGMSVNETLHNEQILFFQICTHHALSKNAT
jgi:hypothetical protein